MQLSIRDVFKLCRELEGRGKRVVNAHIGAPGHSPPIPVKEALESVGEFGVEYAPFAGLEELRRAAARYIARCGGPVLEWENVVVTASGAHAIHVVTLLFRGGKALFPRIGFPLYYPQISLSGAEVELYNPVIEEIDNEIAGIIGRNPDYVLVNYPHNPTGFQPSPRRIFSLYEMLRERGILMVNDAVYHQIYYGDKPPIVGDIIVDSVSKGIALPGLRIGFLYFADRELADKAGKLVYHTTAGASDISQLIAVEMLNKADEAYFTNVRLYYKRKMEMLSKGLAELGFEMTEPKGAFYIFTRHESIRKASEFVLSLLSGDREVYVGVVPGDAFGASEEWMRISYGKLTEEDINLLLSEFEKELGKAET